MAKFEAPKVLDRLGHNGTIEHYRSNLENDIWYKELHCMGCDIRYLVKMKAKRLIGWSIESTNYDETIQITNFTCHRCGRKWAVLDDMEILDAY